MNAAYVTEADTAIGSAGLVTKETWTLAHTPFVLENKQMLPQVEVAYETWGQLSAQRDNVILIEHGLTGSPHAAGKYAASNRSVGFWDGLIGPGKVFDTDRFFVVCANVLGGCRGSTGPASLDPRTSKPYGVTFPIITIRDMVRVQETFLRECFGITELLLVTGGSMGGMQVLEWAVMYPERVRAMIPIATCARLSARGIAFNNVARRAICLDPRWNNGEYYNSPAGGPDAGLGLARMVSTITYLSDEVMEQMFGRKPASASSALDRDLHARFDVERFLHDDAEALVKRFDANSFLYLTKAVDLHDISRGYSSLDTALARVTAQSLLISIRSDDLFPPHETEEIVTILRRHGRVPEYLCLDSAYGHDAFLVEQHKLLPILRPFLAKVAG